VESLLQIDPRQIKSADKLNQLLSKAITAGYTEFERLEVLTKKGQVSSPCGSCRQVIAEFMPTKKIVLHHADQTISEHYMNDLLPFNFKSSALKK